MILVNKSFPTKYRPKKIEGVILLPRIKKELVVDNNFRLDNNLLFSGDAGVGKTTLSKIIIPKGALVVNASYNSSVEDLKDKVTEFCRTADIFNDSSIGGYKIVFLDEFDGVSTKYQEALKAFIEEYENRVRFIATCNNISKIIEPLQSRFTVINFNPKNDEEKKFLKDAYFERVKLINELNDIVMTDNQIKSLININFPDFRSVLKNVQRISINGVSENQTINSDLFDIIFNKESNTNTYNWLISNFGDNVQNLLNMCGRPLSEYIIENEKTYINKLPEVLKCTAKYMTTLQNAIDPVVLALACIYELKEILK